MPKFLNTQGLSTWIPRIIEETERELVIITPYMQLSDKIFNLLIEANERGVETIIIYRENKLSEKDKEKLKSIDNLNLMHHPNIHAKCYYNENFLLIASINLYEYSEKNNREMGILLHKCEVPEFNENYRFKPYDDDNIFEEALVEIVEIINGAHLEKKSRETITEGFEMDILKTNKEKAEEYLKLLNKLFIHKKFELDFNPRRQLYSFVCKSYMDKVDVKIDNNIISFELKNENEKTKTQYKNYDNNNDSIVYRYKGFKMYWNKPETITLYYDMKHHYWEKIDNDEKETKMRKIGIDSVIEFIKSF
jgi:hypothetical protein